MVDIHVPEEELVQPHPAPRQGFGTRRRRLRGGDPRPPRRLPPADRRRLGLLRRPGQIRLGQRHGFDGGGLLAHHRRDRPVAIGTGGRPPKPGANPVPGFISIPFSAAGRGPAPPVSGSGGRHAPALSPSLRPLSVHPGLTPAAEPARRYGDKTEKKVRGFAILQIIRIFATPLRGN